MYMVILLKILFILTKIDCANILIVTLGKAPSHHIFTETYTRGLLDNGHNVTLLTHFDPTFKHSNYTAVLCEDVDIMSSALTSHIHMNAVEMTNAIFTACYINCLDDLQTKGFQQLMNYPDDFKFDLIVWDITGAHCMLPLITKFGSPPLIGISPFLLPHYESQKFGNHLSFYPYYTSKYTYDRMNIFQKLVHHFEINYYVFYYNYWYLPQSYELAKQTFQNYEVLPLDEYERNMMLLLSNSDPIWDDALPLPPNIISVAGIHFNKPQRLPNDLQKVLDNSKEGFIYFSLGTFVKTELLPNLQEMANVLGKLPYQVLWKINMENLTLSLPPNVLAQKWYQQNDILGHKNIKLFISHGGGHSCQEAVYHGVPLVIIPFIVDQFSNAVRLVNRGLALQMLYNNYDNQVFYETILEVLNNPSYKAEAKRYSAMFKEQLKLSSPLDKAVYWTEFVLKHKNLKHLDVVSRDLLFYQSLHLDVILFLQLIVLAILTIIGSLFYYCCRKVKRQHQKVNVSERKKCN